MKQCAVTGASDWAQGDRIRVIRGGDQPVCKEGGKEVGPAFRVGGSCKLHDVLCM